MVSLSVTCIHHLTIMVSSVRLGLGEGDRRSVRGFSESHGNPHLLGRGGLPQQQHGQPHQRPVVQGYRWATARSASGSGRLERGPAAGNCYEPGEYCRNSGHGMPGVAGDGERIVCTDNDGWPGSPRYSVRTGGTRRRRVMGGPGQRQAAAQARRPGRGAGGQVRAAPRRAGPHPAGPDRRPDREDRPAIGPRHRADRADPRRAGRRRRRRHRPGRRHRPRRAGAARGGPAG
jgi:hypothetical protein